MEKRIFKRKELKTKVFFEDEYGEPFVWVESEDISLGGLFLASDVPIRIDSNAFLSFELPGEDDMLKVTGKVVRITGKDGTPTGIGIQFVGLDPSVKEKIEKFIDEA